MAAIAFSLPVDPSKSAKFPISISDQLLREDAPRKRRKVNVQLNHRPKSNGSSIKSIITPSIAGVGHGYNLSMTEENNGNQYLYKGSQQSSGAAALVYDAAKGSFTLDRIDTEFRFNLCSTPTNDDAASLASQYPQLDTGLEEQDGDEDNLFDEHAEVLNPDDESPDPNNPYDYRHFLNSNRAGLSPSPEPSYLDSPKPDYNVGSSSIFRGSSAARSSHPSKPMRRRSHPKPRHLSPTPREEADADNEESEADDVLTIDMGDSADVSNKPWRSILGNLNEGGRNSGPISLRSAASSMSPSLRGDSDVEEDIRSNADVEEIDLGDGGLDVETQSGDGDQAPTPGAALDEDEDEDPFAAQLENQLIAEAMSEAEQEDQGGVRINGDYGQTNGVVQHSAMEESSEESEEE